MFYKVMELVCIQLYFFLQHYKLVTNISTLAP